MTSIEISQKNMSFLPEILNFAMKINTSPVIAIATGPYNSIDLSSISVFRKSCVHQSW